MLSRPIASGAMLAVLIGVVATALWQQAAAVPQADIVDIEIAQEEAEPEPAPAVRPIVTLNGRPVEPPTVAATEPPAEQPEPVVEEAPVPVPAAEEAPTPPVGAQEDTGAAPEAVQEETQVAIAEPPMPRPRPEGLAIRPAEPEIAAPAAPPSSVALESEFMTLEERRALLAPLPQEAYDPRQDGLVAIVGPDGQVIWVYPDQVRPGDSRVTVQGQQSNPYGFIYDEPGYGW